MKTLKQIENDPRVSEVETVYDDGDRFYLLWLRDGYVYDDGSHVNRANTVKELNELLNTVMELTELIDDIEKELLYE